ncbi:MAG: DNA (cytosine-5-)-methyltransferase [Methylocystis sp.]|nr:MAG: DNA (cytosine-5-)-methyltransferase [Methylocystis sp.]
MKNPEPVEKETYKPKRYRVVSLFSGAMGLDLGLHKTGRFEVLACLEKERSFCDTIRANRDRGNLPRSLKVYEGDISQFDPLRILEDCELKPGEVDVLLGGPPCQSFSTAGRRGTVQDPRGTLLWEYLRFIEAVRPRFFIMENVRGLLSAALRHRPIAKRKGEPLEPDEVSGSVVRRFADDLQKIAGGPYHMDCFEVNAVNYGAPQLRERAIFIGNRFNTSVDFPDPTHGPHSVDMAPTLFEAPSQLKPWRTLRDAIGHFTDPGDIIMDFSPRKKNFLSLVPPGSNWRSLPEQLQRESMGKAWAAKGGRSGWWRRLSFDLPCPTLVTMPNHASTSLCHPTEVRALSLREYAAIQEFPSDWEFCGTTSQRYAQVGNAVPVRLGEVAGQVVAEEMDRLGARGWKRSARAPEHYRVIYVQSHVRTRMWFKRGETFVWSDGEENTHATYESPQTLRRISEMRG